MQHLSCGHLLCRLLIAACALADPALSRAQAPPQYTLTDLGSLGGTPTVGEAINTSGSIAGYGTDSNGVSQAFVYNNGSLTQLANLGGGAGVPLASTPAVPSSATATPLPSLPTPSSSRTARSPTWARWGGARAWRMPSTTTATSSATASPVGAMMMPFSTIAARSTTSTARSWVRRG
jgi:probable HAF family extracellular repeat protein